MVDFSRSMPRARDSTTSTSANLSTTRPGRKSASPKITRQEEVSTVSLRYCQAARTRRSRKSRSMTAPASRDRTRTAMVEARLRKPTPRG
ncbi:Uncharacterised protein [Flavonifractor plautii]|uniref:Uncharacterized protein n=1 Tax=Flavonifractor plautii TaxID=292800 RepID=A0A174JQY7_FLAPL|nr:Uncharacterised protein [Flavonifractor plautii]